MTTITAAQKRTRIRGIVVAWVLVAFYGAATVILNVRYVMETGSFGKPMATLIALIPVVAYVGLSEIVAIFRGWLLQLLALATFAGGMGLSMAAIATMVRPAEGPVRSWIYGAVIDVPLAIGLYIVMNKPADCRDLEDAGGLSPGRHLLNVIDRWRDRHADDGPSVVQADQALVDHGLDHDVDHEVDHELVHAVDHEWPIPVGQRTTLALVARKTVPAKRPAPRPRPTPQPRTEPLDRDVVAAEARKLYRESLDSNEPLSKRKLAELFPDRSPSWAQRQITAVKNGPQSIARAQ